MDYGDVAYVIGAAILVLFAGWLLYLSPRQRATRTLAALLACMAVIWADVLLESAPTWAVLAMARVSGTIFTAIGVLSIYFLSIYPRPQGLGRWRHGGKVLFGVWLATASVLLLFPDLWARPVLVDGVVTEFVEGPLSLLGNVWTLTGAGLLVVLAVEHARMPAGPVRRALTLIIAGFTASALCWQTSLFMNDVLLRVDAAVLTPEIVRVQYILEELALVPVLAATAILLVGGLRSGEPERRREGLAVAALAAGIMVVAAVVAFTTPPQPDDWTNAAQGVLDASGGVLLTSFAGYALLKHRLFDIDVKVKWTIRRGTVAAVFLAVFFAVSQVTQEFLTESYGWMAGGVTAGLLLFAIAPLQRVADRVATVAMPGVRDSDLTPERRLAFYRTAVTIALSDGVLTREEERHLAKLAEELGLAHTEALQCREDAARELGIGA